MNNLEIFALKTYSTELFETLWKWYSVEKLFYRMAIWGTSYGYLGKILSSSM